MVGTGEEHSTEQHGGVEKKVMTAIFVHGVSLFFGLKK
jgi:hypothetical protein